MGLYSLTAGWEQSAFHLKHIGWESPLLNLLLIFKGIGSSNIQTPRSSELESYVGSSTHLN